MYEQEPDGFQVGEVVFLASGSPPMTVTHVGDAAVSCHWFGGRHGLGYDGSPASGSFPAAALTRTAPAFNQSQKD